ncbi:MAG: hypothetical protein KAJ33_02085 [Thermoplasmata archaeon]|nr:hypothetical protein [Thermoplasmata archaeon]
MEEKEKPKGIIQIIKPNKLILIIFIVLILLLGLIMPVFPTQTFKTTMVSHTIGEDTIEFENYTSYFSLWEVYHYDFQWVESYNEPPPQGFFPQIDLALTTIIWEYDANPDLLFIIGPLFFLGIYLLSVGLAKLAEESHDESINNELEKR